MVESLAKARRRVAYPAGALRHSLEARFLSKEVVGQNEVDHKKRWINLSK